VVAVGVGERERAAERPVNGRRDDRRAGGGEGVVDVLRVSAGDARVDPLHARKMCAALQHASSGAGPVLFRLERGTGHGSRAVSRLIALQADCLAFLGGALGLMPPAEDR
jgi:prolyl oligopeptidase